MTLLSFIVQRVGLKDRAAIVKFSDKAIGESCAQVSEKERGESECVCV